MEGPLRYRGNVECPVMFAFEVSKDNLKGEGDDNNKGKDEKIKDGEKGDKKEKDGIFQSH